MSDTSPINPRGWVVAIPVVLLLVVIIAVIVIQPGGGSDNDGQEGTGEEATPAEQGTGPLPDELTQLDAGHGPSDDHQHLAVEFEETNHQESAEQLATHVELFEEGFRSIYRDDTEATRHARVAEVISPEVIEYLNFEAIEAGVSAEERDYDIVVTADDLDADILGLYESIAIGEVRLAVALTYTRVEADGTETELGVLVKRSHWKRVDGTWLLFGADT